MLSLGIESTAHTFGIGICDDEKIISNARDAYGPIKGGIHPIEAREHHESVKDAVLEKALDDAEISLNDIDIIAYSAGPGLPPCLAIGLAAAKAAASQTKKPLYAVNHCIAHIEIGRMLCKAEDPITLYVSGGNTQVIGFAGCYRVFGETLDIAIGNCLDAFARECGLGFPGGPAIEKLASKGKKYIELPYVVKGMDLSFSGILTSAVQRFQHGGKIEDVCFSLQETCYAMLTEVTERALAHAGKSEVLLTGGVAASQRLQEMLRIMCSERISNCSFHACPKEFAGDNGAMIAYTGLLMHKAGMKPVQPEKADFFQRWRADEVEVMWR